MRALTMLGGSGLRLIRSYLGFPILSNQRSKGSDCIIERLVFRIVQEIKRAARKKIEVVYNRQPLCMATMPPDRLR